MSAAAPAALRYVDDSRPGLTRRRLPGGKFAYYDADGRRVRDPGTLARIAALAIPPAYREVWICARADGHLQATGRDARGRKQYRYHPDWRAWRDAAKYGQLREFGRALPRIRRRVARDLSGRGLAPDKVAATVVRLLETTLARVGSRAYARENGSFGLTTVTRRHAWLQGSRLRLRFTGKSGVAHDVTVRDCRIARVVKRCLDLPGQQLFHYLDEDGEARPVDSELINTYLREAGGGDFTAKHYRTWAACVLALSLLLRCPAEDAAARRAAVVEVVKLVAARLANTPAVCRACYIHPGIVQAYLDGALPAGGAAPAGPRGLAADERRLLAFVAAWPDSEDR
ncbi:eukaryotic DNA topoisomerase I, catalytic core [Bordetella bronchiseptica GA96-01]|uniref:DNA topoisomerase IB n=1 Tax=Bordetella bronchiseptica TaxID=518 RepID=UPI00045ABC3D|nr:DNA topoisomerase IB [Bordetella bronchiseptica]AZW30926.1 DNA topoisomerase [Bordetella bronchiseptica]KCV41078.1 eukaryotic DNA topoisomerase I, catalytic core [Bordetella bronchiseptica 345]KDC33960.1 eukaryotic DNA topoisomerase I, catalytic core [Bordetella bronchiseptica GA96-01]